jgi:hypothetical protein
VNGRGRALLVPCLVAATVSFTGLVEAADPTPPPGTPTCFERFSPDGPAGLDLRLTCLANELVGTFTNLGDPAGPPIALVVTTLGAIVVGLIVVVVAWRLIRRQAGRRLASVTPAAWWVCPSCRSLNAPSVAACYACGTPWTLEAAVAPTAPDPPAD